MKLYWCPKTRAVRAVWMLEELGVPYERVFIDIGGEELHVAMSLHRCRMFE